MLWGSCRCRLAGESHVTEGPEGGKSKPCAMAGNVLQEWAKAPFIEAIKELGMPNENERQGISPVGVPLFRALQGAHQLPARTLVEIRFPWMFPNNFAQAGF